MKQQMEMPKSLSPTKDLGQLNCSMVIVEGCQGLEDSGGLSCLARGPVTTGSGGRADKAARPTFTGVLFLWLLKTSTPVGKAMKGPIQLPLAFPRERMGFGLAGPGISLLK